jgi:hypothetical protein
MTTKPTALPEPKAWLMVYPGGRSQLRYARDSAQIFLKDGTDLKSYSLHTQQQLIDYGRAEYLRAIEQCAKVCEDTESVTYIFAGQLYDSAPQTLGNAIDAIRAIKEQKT